MPHDPTLETGREDEALDDNAFADGSFAGELDETIVFEPQAGSDAPSADDQLAAERDRSLRLQAELQNVLARTARELNEQRRYAPLDVIRDLLPAIDNIDRAIDAAEKSPDPTTLLEGFRLVRQQLASVLERSGCKPIEAAGAPFDPHLHQAILQQPSADHPAGTVMLVAQGGYQLHDRVVRPAQVIVASSPA
ncbi:MAG: nucleotide exchange factor GrpE [Lacipirellulaceae bacterium]